jgi:hypothetical protein
LFACVSASSRVTRTTSGFLSAGLPIATAAAIASGFIRHGQRRAGGTLVIEAATEEVDKLLRGSARLIGISVLEDEQVDVTMASIAQRAETAIKAMGRQGTMKRLRTAVAQLDRRTELAALTT